MATYEGIPSPRSERATAPGTWTTNSKAQPGMSAESPSAWESADAHEALLHTNATINRKIRSAWTGFLNFALRDNVLEVAVGLMYVIWN